MNKSISIFINFKIYIIFIYILNRYLHRNNFSGNIPESYKNLKNLIIM